MFYSYAAAVPMCVLLLLLYYPRPCHSIVTAVMLMLMIMLWCSWPCCAAPIAAVLLCIHVYSCFTSLTWLPWAILGCASVSDVCYVLLWHPCVVWLSDTSFTWCAYGYNYKVIYSVSVYSVMAWLYLLSNWHELLMLCLALAGSSKLWWSYDHQLLDGCLLYSYLCFAGDDSCTCVAPHHVLVVANA